MKIYCMSDIHGCLEPFEKALSLVIPHLEDEDTMLILLGDYIHGGEDSHGVLDRVIGLQKEYGSDKVVALMGNHEEFVLYGYSTIDEMNKETDGDLPRSDYKYFNWMKQLPRYHKESNTIFVHAGIDEEAGEMWEYGTSEEMLVSKYPATTGKVEGLSQKIVAGHVGTCEIAQDDHFHDIYMDESHVYIDGTVLATGVIPVLLVDTDIDKYYRVTNNGKCLLVTYEMEK